MSRGEGGTKARGLLLGCSQLSSGTAVGGWLSRLSLRLRWQRFDLIMVALAVFPLRGGRRGCVGSVQRLLLRRGHSA